MRDNGTYYDFDQIIGNNIHLVKTIEYGKKIAAKNASVLIYGETGTGKELFAQSIHNNSLYKEGPFIAVNCAAIPVNLIESVLFGTVSGAFTGAKNKQGLLHLSNNGSIFLDEINSMDLDSQAKLLRFLQERTVRSVGDNKQQRINCRVISAINKDIELEIKENRMREDLYYRLSAFTLAIPPLRERFDDILVLSRHFIRKFNEECGNSILDIDSGLSAAFLQYHWPGNIRELEHVIESAVNMAEPDEQILNEHHLSSYLRKKFFPEEGASMFTGSRLYNDNKTSFAEIPSHDKSVVLTDSVSDSRVPIENLSNGPHALVSNHINNNKNTEPEENTDCFILTEDDSRSLHEILDGVERTVIVDRLRRCSGNISQTAKELGIFRQALQYRIKKYNIRDDEY